MEIIIYIAYKNSKRVIICGDLASVTVLVEVGLKGTFTVLVITRRLASDDAQAYACFRQ